MKEKIDIDVRWHRIGAKPHLSTSAWGNYLRDRDEDVCDIAQFTDMQRYAELKVALQPYCANSEDNGRWSTVNSKTFFFADIMPVAQKIAMKWAEQKGNECPEFLTAQTRTDDNIVNFAAVLSRADDGENFGWEMQIRISSF